MPSTDVGSADALMGKPISIRLEPFRFCLNQNRAPDSCFDAFSSREPVSTSLENALGTANLLRRRGFDGAACEHADQMRAIFGAAVQIAVQPLGGGRDAVEH